MRESIARGLSVELRSAYVVREGVSSIECMVRALALTDIESTVQESKWRLVPVMSGGACLIIWRG